MQRLDGFDLLDYNARYYDATLGRFISPDSMVPDYGNPQDLNRYSYVRGNPLRFTDPSGHAVDAGGAMGGKDDDKPPVPPVIVGTSTVVGQYNPNTSTNIASGANGLGVPAGFATLYTTIDKVGDYYDYLPTSLGRMGNSAVLILPMITGAAGVYDIEQRYHFGMLSTTQRNQEQALNIGSTAASTGINSLMIKATSQSFVVGGSTPALLPVLTNPATIFVAVPCIGYVIAWEQQTVNNRIEGMSSEQAWKTARDTVSEPFLNLIGKSRDSHPEWYWYP